MNLYQQTYLIYPPMNQLMPPSARDYILRFNESIHYTKINDHANSIFWAFNIPSWLHPSYKVRILNRIDDQTHNITLFVVTLDSTPAEDEPQFINLYFYEVFRDNNEQRLEYYVQEQEGPLQRRNRMTVRLNKYPQQKNFTITITDHQNFFTTKLKQVDDILYLTKDHDPMTPNMLEYNFIEPENIRYKKQLKCKLCVNIAEHFHLAFQGGGAKGIAYIGAYKAIRIMLPNDKVTSVIGSSAGSMCALAIASQISPEEISQLFAEMDQIPKDRTIKTAHDLSPQVLAETTRIKLRIRQFLHQYGLIPNTFCNYFSKIYLDDDEFVHSVLDYALLDNQSVRDMLSLPTTEPVFVNNGQCCGPQYPAGYYQKQKLTNLYGFLQGKLMTGSKVLDITQKVIKKVLDKARRQDPILFNKTFTANARFQPTQVLAKTVTMHQFYQFTGVELTCTGTDLDSQILRFFNQKTTPYLPVRMAVIMSASFPIAFEARKWKKQWGKYYVHHSNTRLEIDITGHQFSDGGILANLPVMYLDNEEMRPMIFSHMRTPSTKVYGFGLDQITQQSPPQLQKIRQQKFSDLRCKIITQTPICGICCYTCCCVPPDEHFSSFSVASVDDIPPLAFVKKLIRTYRHANTNLVMEIFRKSIYHFGAGTTLTRSLLFAITPELVTQYKDIKQSLMVLSAKLKSMNNEQYGILAYFRIVRQRLKKIKTLDQIILAKAVYQLIFKLLIIFISQQKSRINYINDRNFQVSVQPSQDDALYQKTITQIGAKIQSINFKLQSVGRQDYFVYMNDVPKQQKRLIDISQLLCSLSSIINDAKYFRIKNRLLKMFQNFFKYYQQHFLDILSGLLNDLNSKIVDLEYAVSKQARTIRNCRSIKQLQSFYETFGYYQIDEFIAFQKCFLKLEQPQIKAQRIYSKQEPAIIYYIQQKINRRTSPNVHLVLQGRGTIPQLNLQAFKTVRQYLREIQSQQLEQTLNIMASLIINDPVNQKSKSFDISDLFILVVARADLTLKLQQRLKQLEEIQTIDLGYIQYQIPPSLQKKLMQIRDKRRFSRCRITNVTTSGITVLLMLLTILGFQNEKVQEEMRIISQFMYMSPYKIEKKFQAYSWAIPLRCRIRELQDLMWQERFEIFTAMENGINEHKLPLNFQVIRQQFQQSRESIFQSFRQVLEYISTIEYKSTLQKDPRDFFNKKMSLNTGTKDYYKMNRDVSIATKAMVKSLVQLFQNQIKLAIFTSGNVWINDIIEGFPDPNIHEWLWKGLIIENLIDTMLVRRHIKRILSEKNIDPDIKLKDFYRVSPLKITLTFTAVDLTSNQFVFINQFTHPQLPLWMALTSSTSLPLIFPKVTVRPVYLNKINPSQAERKLEQLLLEGNEEHYKHLYTSGNLLDILPLDLLTSYQTRKLYFDDKQFTFLSFGNQLIEPTPEPRTFYRKFPKFCDYLKLLCTGISNGFGIEPGRILTDKTAIVQTYLNSHDNYIYQIYKGNLLRLPIRLGTLDFHKVGKGNSLAQETLFQTQLSTFEKFSSTRRTYIQFILNNNKLIIRMISRDINNNDIQSKYRLEFKTVGWAGYQRLTKRAIEMDLSQERQLYLRFYFVQNKQIVEREYFIDIMSLFDPYHKFKATYMLEYVKVLNTYLPPLSQPQKSLRSAMPGPPIDMLMIRSLVNIQQTGLYCQVCCCPLKINKHYYAIPITQSQCYHCKQVKETRFICTNKQIKCPGIYCMLCCNKFYYKKQQELKCAFGHLMEFRNHRSYKLLSEQQVPFVRCSCCQQASLDFYQDKQCETYVCLKCVVTFVDK